MILKILKRQEGNALIEFTLCLSLWLLFISGLLSVTIWGVGAAFVREAAFEAAREYAVYIERSRAVESAENILRKGSLFIDKNTAQINVNRDDEYAVASVSVEPRIKNILGYFQMPLLRRDARCALEYRFRSPEEFVGP